MKETAFKTFIRETYNSKSPIPYFITVQVVIFVLIHLFELISLQTHSSINLYSLAVDQLSLPPLFSSWLRQPWSILTHPFVYSSLLALVFDSLWLYWIGNIFLNLLSKRHFLFIFCGGILLGALCFLLVHQLPYFKLLTIAWSSITFGLAALLGALTLLAPTTEIRLLLFGNVKLKTIAIVYCVLEITLFVYMQHWPIVIALVISTLFGIASAYALLKGNDWSLIFQKKRKSNLKIISSRIQTSDSKDDQLPNQDAIDRVLDKISSVGYDNLSAQDKEILFKASRKN